VPSGLSGVTAVAAGYYHSLALKSDGTVVVWGCGQVYDYGQCTVPSGLSGVTAVGGGYSHSLALKSDGTVVTWGCGNYDSGQCDVPSGLARVSAVAAGFYHSLALVELMNQTITFDPLANKTYGDPDFTVNARASSGLAVSFAASGNCTVNGATVHLTSAGSCTVRASQAGNENYNPAADVSRTFSIAAPPPPPPPPPSPRRVRCIVPRVIGLRLGRARMRIRARHCSVGRVRRARSRRVGRVLAQSPRPGRRLRSGARVNLVVGRR
jgi:Regulator of chromosome condensation (RCC1) repeat/PASTA domain